MNLLIGILFAPFFAFAQSEFVGEGIIKEEIQLLNQKIEKYRSAQGSNVQYIEKLDKKIKELKSKKETLEKLNSEREINKTFILQEIEKFRSQKKPLFGGKRKEFYSCLESSIENSGIALVYDCRVNFPIKPSVEEIEFFQVAQEKLRLSSDEVLKEVKLIEDQIQESEKHRKGGEDNLNAAVRMVAKYQKEIDQHEIFKKDYSHLRDHPEFVNCNNSTPELNLENEIPFPNAGFKGVLNGVPRDNQDGVGTCYANVGRVLLYAATDGKVDASFLDMALQYKVQTNELSKDALDGGTTCQTIDAIKEKGYCPQSEAPLETGNKNPAIETILGRNDYSMYFQASTLKMLKEFIATNEVLEKKESLSEGIHLKKAEYIIKKIKENPDLKIPLPVARFQIPPKWKLMASSYKKHKEIEGKEEEFLDEHKKRFQKFFPKYLSYLASNKDRNFIFNEFIKENNDFVEKYQMQSEVNGWLEGYLLETEEDADPKKFKKSFKSSLSFLKEISNRTTLSDEDFISTCGENLIEEFEMLNKLYPLIDRIKNFEVDPKKLLDKDGNFKKGADLMQLAIAPGCLNSENRKQIEQDFSCFDSIGLIDSIKTSSLPKESQKRAFRERILMSLLQGLPVGNSFKTSSTVGHINTIVGLRFNPESKQCEYLIRESQDGTSKWEPESKIFDKVNEIKEVRK